jgi:hypothetical protein
MKAFLRKSKKAIASGLSGGASAAGIVVSDLDWRAIIGAVVFNALVVWWSPSNEESA